MNNNTLLVFLFHGVGGEHPINISLETHKKLLEFLKANENNIWITTFLDVADFIRKYRTKSETFK